MPDSPDTDSAEADRLHQEALEEELEAARRKRETYQMLLKELPEVFEGKFRERIRPLQQRNDQLIEEGQVLREQIRRVLPPPAREPAAIAPSREPAVGDAWPRSMPAAMALVALLALGGLALLLQLAPGAKLRPAGPAGQGPFAGRKESAASATGSADGVASVAVRTTGTSWVEVRDGNNRILFSNELKGARRFPLGQGLRIRSGRADLVRIQVDGQPERPLGPIDFVDWTRVPPAGPGQP
jgi:hypothetical protein